MEQVTGFLSVVSTNISTYYQKLPPLATRVQSFTDYFLGSPHSYLTPDLKNRNIKALIKKESLDAAAKFISENHFSSFQLIAAYLQKGHLDKVKELMQHTEQVSGREFMELAAIIEKEIEALKDNETDKKSWTDLLKDVLNKAVKATDNIRGSWTADPSETNEEKNVRLQNVDEKLNLYVMIAQCHRRLSNDQQALMVLSKANNILFNSDHRSNYSENEGKILYLYAAIYFSLKDQTLSEKCLGALKTKEASLNENDLKKTASALDNFVGSTQEVLSQEEEKSWEKRNKLFKELLQSELKTTEISRLFSDDLQKLCHLASVLHKMRFTDDAKSQLNKINEKTNVSGLSNSIHLFIKYASLCRTLELPIAQPISIQIKEYESSIMVKTPQAQEFFAIKALILDYFAQKENDKALAILDSLTKHTLTIELKDQVQYVYLLVYLFKQIGKQDEGQKYFANFVNLNPSRPTNPAHLINDASRLLSIEQREYARSYLVAAEELLRKDTTMTIEDIEDKADLANSLIQVYSQFDADAVLRLVDKYSITAQQLPIRAKALAIAETIKKYTPAVLLGIAPIIIGVSIAFILNKSGLLDKAVTWYRQSNFLKRSLSTPIRT